MGNNKNGSFKSDFIGEYVNHLNIDTTLITISESKAEVIYHSFVTKKPNLGISLSLFGIFVSSLLALLTSNFKDIFGINNSKYTIIAIFIIITAISFICSSFFFVKFLADRKKYSCSAFISLLNGQNFKQKKK